MTAVVSPAVLAYSRKEFEETLALLAGIPGVTQVQIDLVDGVCAAPPSWPYVESEALHVLRNEQRFLPFLDRIEYEVDLMSGDIDKAVSDWLALGVSRVTLHAGALADPAATLKRVRLAYGGARAAERSSVTRFGIAIGVDTDESIVAPALPYADYVQFMGIAQVGKQGEPFDARVVENVRNFHRAYPHVPIQVDGGVTLERAKQLAAVGATTFVVGSAILHAENPKDAFDALDAVLDMDFSQGGINRLNRL